MYQFRKVIAFASLSKNVLNLDELSICGVCDEIEYFVLVGRNMKMCLLLNTVSSMRRYYSVLSEHNDDWMASLSLQNNCGQSNSEYVQTEL